MIWLSTTSQELLSAIPQGILFLIFTAYVMDHRCALMSCDGQDTRHHGVNPTSGGEPMQWAASSI